MAEAATAKQTLDELVTEILSIVSKSKGPDLRTSSFLHLLSPGLVQKAKPLTDAITYRQVNKLLDRVDAGDHAAATAVFVKYFPIVLGSLRNLDANTRVPKPGTKVKLRKAFSFDDFKHLGMDKEDLLQEAARLLYTLLRRYNRRSSVFLGWYLRIYFRARFSTFVRDTMTYMEGGKRKVKIGALAHGGLPEDLPALPDTTGSPEVQHFAGYMEVAATRAYLMRDLLHYGVSVRSRARTEDLVAGILQRGWVLEAQIWRRSGDPPVPATAEPVDGRVILYFLKRDPRLDEYFRTDDAHRHLPDLQRGKLGGDQITVFAGTYGTDRVTDEDLALRLGKQRPAVSRARGRAEEYVVQLALGAYVREVRLAIKSQ